MQVFEVHDGAAAFYEEQLAGSVRAQVLDGPGYQAFVHEQQSDKLEALFLLSQGEYVNVNLHGFPRGSVETLTPLIVDRLRRWARTSG